MKKINIDKIIYILLFITLLFIPIIKILSYIINYIGLTKDIFVVNQAYVLWLSIPFFLITYIYKIVKKKVKINILDQIIYCLIITGIQSTIFAVNIKTSIFGFYTRYEGLLSLISYYLIFLNIKSLDNKKYAKNLITLFIVLGVFQTINGILEVYTDLSFIVRAERPYMAMAFCGNPNFYGAYMVMLSLLATCLYLLKNNNKYLLLTILFFAGLCLAQSTGPFLGYIITFIFFIICYKKRLNFKRVGSLVIILILIFCSSEYFIDLKYNNNIEANYTIKNDLDIVESKFLKINNDKIRYNKGFDNGRLNIWINSLPLIKKYYLVGAGLDNYYYIFKKYPLDKAHNIYLQILITNGLLSLLLYLLLCFIIFIKCFKRKNTLIISLYIAFIGYSIQGFANISTIDVAPYFFMIMGIIANEKLFINAKKAGD